MTTFPGSPRLVKGGIVTLDPTSGTVRRVIPLQYNPDSVSRSLTAQTVGGQGGAGQGSGALSALRFTGPPVETINVEAELDAADQLEFPLQNTLTAQFGIRPALDALEMLLYPTSESLVAANNLSNSGALEILSVEAPLIVFVWGKRRIAPVRLTEFSVTEQAFDPNLNPLRASVKLGMRVLTVSDVGFSSRAGALAMAEHRRKEELAARSAGAALSALGLTGI